MVVVDPFDLVILFHDSVIVDLVPEFSRKVEESEMTLWDVS